MPESKRLDATDQTGDAGKNIKLTQLHPGIWSGDTETYDRTRASGIGRSGFGSDQDEDDFPRGWGHFSPAPPRDVLLGEKMGWGDIEWVVGPPEYIHVRLAGSTIACRVQTSGWGLRWAYQIDPNLADLSSTPQTITSAPGTDASWINDQDETPPHTWTLAVLADDSNGAAHEETRMFILTTQNA
jgi:hypothetical protein